MHHKRNIVDNDIELDEEDIKSIMNNIKDEDNNCKDSIHSE